LKEVLTMLNASHMKKLYIPFTGQDPAFVSVNGHQIVLVSRDARSLTNGLKLIGGDTVHEVAANSLENPVQFFRDLYPKDKDLTDPAVPSAAHIVLTPPETEVWEVLRSLELELPWVQ